MKQKQKKMWQQQIKNKQTFEKKSIQNLVGGGSGYFSPVAVPDAGPSPDEAFERARPLLRVQQLLQGLGERLLQMVRQHQLIVEGSVHHGFTHSSSAGVVVHKLDKGKGC